MLGRQSRWRVWVCESAAKSLLDAATTAHPAETGGILVGVLVGTRPWVTHAVEIKSSGSSAIYYELPAGVRHRVVAELRKQDHRLGYLGEWHSHPADVGPSRTDIASLRQIAADPTSGCARPLLIVARRTQDHYRLDAGQLVQRIRRVRLVTCGPLPRSSAEPDSMPTRPAWREEAL
jgi:proteasome lid subunit RPN8/RPN11